MITVMSPTLKNEKTQNLTETIKSLEAQCRNCKPITPLECMSRCRVYKLKNELRSLWETMENPNYVKELFNALKNGTRLRILQIIVNCRCSASQIQHELRKAGFSHSQENINKEYLRPLMSVGLITAARDEYYPTSFGKRIIERLGCFSELADKLPARSQFYEEALLQSLLSGPKTFEEIKTILPSKDVSRTLKRLRSAGLIETPEANSYIFFFRSKRDSSKETFSATEQRIYDAIANEGTPAGTLTKETGICLRRTYKYIRGLKGKKMVFARRKPKTYGLTCVGKNLASVMQDVQLIVEATWDSSQQVMQESTLAPSFAR